MSFNMGAYVDKFSGPPTDERPLIRNGGTSFTRHRTEEEKQQAPMEERLSKATRLDFEDTEAVGIHPSRNRAADDGWE